MGLVQEFKEFALKGNVVDMAVGVIIGGAFGTIVNSLVGDIMMPLFGVLTGGTDFSKLAIELGPENFLKYGSFIQNIINFLIIAGSMFAMIKVMNTVTAKFKKKRKQKLKNQKVRPRKNF
ncbi:MAG: large conductance mechanosensitive channel protein MscL [Lachnospiraceae bacterium]